MAHGYLGEFDVDIVATPFKDHTPADWAMEHISRYGGIDGEHHKAWVFDQIARILKGTPVILKEARWDRGGTQHTEYRYWTGEPSEGYHLWVKGMLGEQDEDGEYEYDYDVGICP